MDGAGFMAFKPVRAPMRAVLTRRGLLRRVGAGALGTAAGCVGGDGSPPGAVGTTTETIRPYEGPAYGRWLPIPPALETERYPFGSVNLSAFSVRGDTLPRGLQESPHVDGWQPVEVNWRDVTLSLSLRGSFVIEGTYDPDAVVDDVLATDGWSEHGTYQGYDLVVTADESGAVAVSGTAIVVGLPPGGGATAVDAAEAIIDAGRGAAERYVASSDALADLVAEIGEGSIVEWRPQDPPHESDPEAGRFAGQIGLGRWGRIVDPETTDVKLVLVFEGEPAAEQTDLEAYVDANREQGAFAGWSDVRIARNGRLAVIAGTITTG